jgi:hypothetical protein
MVVIGGLISSGSMDTVLSDLTSLPSYRTALFLRISGLAERCVVFPERWTLRVGFAESPNLKKGRHVAQSAAADRTFES